MTETIRVLEGTWEELARHADALAGKRLRLTVLEDDTAPAAREKTLGEELDDIAGAIPPEEWKEVPRDLTDQMDHYLYGVPTG